MMLKNRFVLCALLVMVAATCRSEDVPATKLNTNPAFEKIKSLAGTWVEADAEGKPTEKVFSIVKVTAGGSAVHETIYPGGDMEMISVYHMDNDDLLMTHYCMLGNQPHMKADPQSPANQIRWQFVGGTNFDPAKDAHMHSSTLTFTDEDHIEIAGEAWADGKPCDEHCGMMKLVRKK